LDSLAADLDAFSLEHRPCGDLDGGIEEAGDGTARVWLACLSLLTDQDAVFTGHHTCGDLEAGLDWPMVWIACDCGATMARRADETPQLAFDG